MIKEKIGSCKSGFLTLTISLFILVILQSCSSKEKSTQTEVHLLNIKVLEQQKQIDNLSSQVRELKQIPLPEQTNHQEPAKKSQPASDVQAKPEKPKFVPLTPDRLYQLGRDYFLKNEIVKAEKCFKKFIEKYPDHELADNALYWSAEIKYIDKQFEAAIIIFEKVCEQYPDENKAPDALLKKGYSYMNLDQQVKAKEIFTNVIKIYPFSPAGAKAETILNTL